MQLGQQQLELGQGSIACKSYEKAFTEALWLLRYHLTQNCTEATVTQLVAMCRNSLLAYEELASQCHEEAWQLEELQGQYSSTGLLGCMTLDNKPGSAFKALLETTAKLWDARPVLRALVLDSAAQ